MDPDELLLRYLAYPRRSTGDARPKEGSNARIRFTRQATGRRLLVRAKRSGPNEIIKSTLTDKQETNRGKREDGKRKETPVRTGGTHNVRVLRKVEVRAGGAAPRHRTTISKSRAARRGLMPLPRSWRQEEGPLATISLLRVRHEREKETEKNGDRYTAASFHPRFSQ